MNQDYFTLKDLIATKVSKDELMYEGFESLYGNKQIRPPLMDYAHGDFRTINVGWIPPQYYTKTSHYLLQVSDNNVDWRGLRFDGQDFGYDIDTVTTVFSSNIAHTRIPFLNGGIRILYYRAATVSKDGEISEWSSSIVGNTFFVEQSDIRGADFVYPLQGTIQLSSEFDTGQFSYIAEGGMTISGAAIWGGWFDYIAYNGTGEIKLTSSFQNEQEVDIVEIASGIIQTGGLAWKEVTISQEIDFGITGVTFISGVIEDTNRYACWYYASGNYRKLFNADGSTPSGWDPSSPYNLGMEKMSSTKWLRISNSGGNYYVYLHSSSAQLDYESFTVSIVYASAICRLSDTKALIVYSDYANVWGVFVTIDGNSLIVDTRFLIEASNTNTVRAIAVSETKAIVAYLDNETRLRIVDTNKNVGSYQTISGIRSQMFVSPNQIILSSPNTIIGEPGITKKAIISINDMSITVGTITDLKNEFTSLYKNVTVGNDVMAVYRGETNNKLYSKIFFK